jgi:hypothetical protein
MDFLIVVILITLVALWISSKIRSSRKTSASGAEAVLMDMALSTAVDPRTLTPDAFALWLASQDVFQSLELFRDMIPTEYPGTSQSSLDLLERRICYLQSHRSDTVDTSPEAMAEDTFWRQLEAREGQKSV